MFQLVTPERTFPLWADTGRDADEWMVFLLDVLGLADKPCAAIHSLM